MYRGVYDNKPPDHEGVGRGMGVVYCHKPRGTTCALTDIYIYVPFD